MKNDKEVMLEFAEQNGWKYPRLWTCLTFSLVGGVIGGLFFGICLAGSEWLYLKESFSILNAVKDILISSIAGFFVGFLPASVTGIYVALRKIIISKKVHYLELFLIGGIITIIFGLNWLIYYNKKDNLVYIQFYLDAMILGGLTSIICGKLFVPKLKNLI